jgi:glucokinase
MAKKFLGIDIGGSYIKFADSDGKKFKEKNPYDYEKIIDLINRVSQNYDSIGIAVAGFVNFDGFIYESPNIKSLNGKKIEVKGRPYFVANDATLACFGEVSFGAGRKWKRKGIVVCLTLGTGLGGGAVIDGKPLFGARGIAMEVGHIQISDDIRRICVCGRIGCSEEFVSSRAIERFFFEIASEKTTSEKIIELANKGNINAIEALRKFSFYVARVIQNVSHIFNPDAVIISGGIINHFNQVIDMIKHEARKIIIKPIFDSMEILPAELGEFSGAFGGLKMAQIIYRKTSQKNYIGR